MIFTRKFQFNFINLKSLRFWYFIDDFDCKLPNESKLIKLDVFQCEQMNDLNGWTELSKKWILLENLFIRCFDDINDNFFLFLHENIDKIFKLFAHLKVLKISTYDFVILQYCKVGEKIELTIHMLENEASLRRSNDLRTLINHQSLTFVSEQRYLSIFEA
jgi:hypothetical protein